MGRPALLSSARVAITGLGLMGGSLAMALRGKCAAVLGVDREAGILDLARQMKVADQVSHEPENIFPHADLIILATPVRAIIEVLDRLPDLHPGNAVVMDLGSTKTEVVSAMAGLPDRFDPVGGHPMCGKERSSLLEADPRLYQGAAFALVSLPATSDRARSLAEQVVLAVGAYPIWLKPEDHDLWTAFTSHLPYLVSNTLAAVAPHEAASLIGPGFRSASRLAVTSPRMMLDTLLTNRENILKSIDDFRSHLDRIRDLLERVDDEALLALLAQGAQRREELYGDLKQGGGV